MLEFALAHPCRLNILKLGFTVALLQPLDRVSTAEWILPTEL